MTHPQLDAWAHVALEKFGLFGARLTFIGASDHTVFRADVPGRGSFALRLHTASNLDRRAVESELVWLESLPGTGELVPRPRRGRANELVVQVGDGDTMATALSWLDGEVSEELPSGPRAAKAGALLAALHRHAEAFVPPPGFTRPIYDLEAFRRGWHELRSRLELQAGQVATIERGWPVIKALLSSMRDVPGGFGLIHADAHPGNFVWQGEEPRLIDFGRLGWGAFLHDIAYCVLNFEAPVRAAFFEGYRSVRFLPNDIDAHLRALMALTALDNLAFLARRPHEHPFVLEALPSVATFIENLTPTRASAGDTD